MDQLACVGKQHITSWGKLPPAVAGRGIRHAPAQGVMCLKFLKLCIVTVFIVGCVSEGEGLPTGSDQAPFDSATWLLDNSVLPEPLDPDDLESSLISDRERMLKDLVTNFLPGKNRAEIEEILGPSLETNYFSSINKDFIYYMGPERDSIFVIDSEWLLIWLGENGEFERYDLYND